MSTRRTNDFVVGLVVIAATVVIIAAALWVQRADFGQTPAPVLARFRDVGNAQVGNAVVVRGVRAGRIEGVELAPGGWVRVRLRLDDGIELPPDPVVIVGQSTLFGEWQATITERSAVPPDRDIDRQLAEASTQPGVLPGATLPDVAQLTAVAGRIAGDVASVADRVQVAFDDSAARELRSSIRDVAQVAADARDHGAAAVAQPGRDHRRGGCRREGVARGGGDGGDGGAARGQLNGRRPGGRRGVRCVGGGGPAARGGGAAAATLRAHGGHAVAPGQRAGQQPVGRRQDRRRRTARSACS